MTATNAYIAAALNAKAWTRKQMVVSRKRLGDLHGPEVNVDCFPGQVALDCQRMDGEPWTAALVATEMPGAAPLYRTTT